MSIEHVEPCHHCRQKPGEILSSGHPNYEESWFCQDCYLLAEQYDEALWADELSE